MKLLFTFVSILLISFGTFAQTMNGKVTLGGEISFNSVINENKNNFSDYIEKESHSDFTIGPSLGYFLKDNLKFGIGLRFQNSRDDYEAFEQYNSHKNQTSIYSIISSLRYYGEMLPSFGFWGDVQISAGFGSSKTTGWDYDGTLNPPKIETEFDLSNFSVSLNPGIYYYLNDHFELNLSFGGLYYARSIITVTKPKLTEKPENVINQFGFEFSLRGLTLGVNYIF